MNKNIFLYINLYPINNNDRFQEIIFCLKRNIENDEIDKIFVFAEHVDKFINHIPKSNKIEIYAVLTRPTYSCFMEKFTANSINIISNNDIYFDKSIALAKYLPKDAVFALTRHEPDGTIFNARKGDSQDTWIFNGETAIRPNYYMGVPGCDNRIAFDLWISGYIVLNPSKKIKSHHLHHSKARNYSVADRLFGYYNLLKPVGIVRTIIQYSMLKLFKIASPYIFVERKPIL